MSLVVPLLLCTSSLSLTACVGIRQKQAELTLLKSERDSIQNATISLTSGNSLSHVVISADSVNSLLSNLDGYHVKLAHPKGAVATLDKVRMGFSDGVAEALIDASATDRNHLVSVKLRIVSDIYTGAHDSAIHLRFEPIEILPAVKFSIFHWHEFWFAARLLRIEADKYADSLPDVVIPLRKAIPISVNPSDTIDFSMGNKEVQADLQFPDRSLNYNLSLAHLVVLRDGVHAFVELRGF